MSSHFADLAALSHLLDEAIDLSGAETQVWLDRLPPEHRHLRQRLLTMLAQHASTVKESVLDKGPALSDAAAVGHRGEQIGPYVLLKEIGRGGMASVWLAERTDGLPKRRVALKLPRLAWDAGLAERMARERDIAARLTHPNIAELHDAGVDQQGRPYLAFEYVEGRHIDRWCASHRLGVRERLTVFVSLARAVAYAHGQQVVHRDIKPANVIVTLDGQPHLIDFGIAKRLNEATPGDSALTQEQGRCRTPRYASPEQIRGDTVTVRSDVFSLGALLYELLTGQTPHRPSRNTVAAMEEAVLDGEPALASRIAESAATRKLLRGEIDAVLTKALRRERDSRYATADAMADDIDRYLRGERVLARGDSIGYRARKVLHHNLVVISAGTAVVLAFLAGASVAGM